MKISIRILISIARTLHKKKFKEFTYRFGNSNNAVIIFTHLNLATKYKVNDKKII